MSARAKECVSQPFHINTGVAGVSAFSEVGGSILGNANTYKMCQTLNGRPLSDGQTLCNDANSTVWFDIKVFYTRISASEIVNKTLAFPESLTVHCLPRGDGAVLEINGRRIRASASAFLTLRRSGAEGNRSGDLAYVGTDNFRTTGDLRFQIYARDEALISGALEKKKREDFSDEAAGEGLERATWAVECTCALDYSSRWAARNSSFPAVEVCVAGRISGFPAVLTQTVQLIPRRMKCVGRHNALDVIPEGNENESTNSTDYELYESETWNEGCMRYHEEDHEFSWLKGIGIGIGIGLGMCIAVGWLFTASPSRRRRLPHL